MTTRKHQSRRCRATHANGTPCRAWAIKGGMVCKAHGGLAPQVRAKANIRVEVESWGLGDTTVDPGETLLRLVSQSRWRAEDYARELAGIVAREGSIEAAVTGTQKVLNPNTGNLVEVGEYVRAMAQLEAAERDRCARFAKMAIEAGLAERLVRLADRQGAIIEAVLATVFERLELTDEQRRAAPAALRAAIEAAS